MVFLGLNRKLTGMKSLSSLNKYFWKYKFYLIWGIITVIASNLFTIYPAQIIRTALDMIGELLSIRELTKGFEIQAGLMQTINRSLLLFGGLMVGIAILSGVFLFFTRQTIIYMSRLIEYDLRNDIFIHYQELSTRFYRKNRTGDLMSRITEDVNKVRMYLGPAVMYTLNTFTRFVLVITAMFSINPKLAIFSLLPLPVLSFMIYLVQSVIEKRSRKIQEQLATMNTFTQEIYSGIRVVKAYVKEKEILQRFETETETYRKRTLHSAKVDAVFFPAVTFLVGLSGIFLIWIGSEQVIEGTLTIGNIAEFTLYVGLLAWPIISLGWVTTLIQQAAASQKRINEILNEGSDVQFPDSDYVIEKPSVQWKSVTFTYPDTGITALKNVSFTLSPGQKLGIVGPAGSGKSTICQLTLRMFDITSGEILIDGRPIQQYSKTALRSISGYAPQDVFLFSDSVSENIAFGLPEATQSQVEEAAKFASVYENISGFPQGFDTLIGERGVMLSGGQKQRLSIARACIRKPKILILDDVLSAVDTETEETLLRNIQQFRKEQPDSIVIQIAHRLSCVQDSDYILALDNGVVIEEGTHESLLRKKGYYAGIYEKQLSETLAEV